MAKSEFDKDAERAKKNGKKAEGAAAAIEEAKGEGRGSLASEDTGAAERISKRGAKREEKKEGSRKSRTGGAKRDGNKPKARQVLRKAVKEQIKVESDEIASALVDKVMSGDKRSAEMMLSLIQKKKNKGDGASKRHGGLTTADLLGSEDEWESESFEAVEGKSETGMGGREPENQGEGTRD